MYFLAAIITLFIGRNINITIIIENPIITIEENIVS